MTKWIGICSLVSLSGCGVVPDIISVGECERGIVTSKNVLQTQEIWPQAQTTDVLITGGCYQEKLIKKR